MNTDFPTWGSGKGTENPQEFEFGDHWDLITELTQDWGNRLFVGTNKTLCAPGSRRKEQLPHKSLSQMFLWVSRSLRQRCRLAVACCRVWDTEGSSVCVGPFKGGRHYIFITSTIVWSQLKQQGRNTVLPINRKVFLNLIFILYESMVDLLVVLVSCIQQCDSVIQIQNNRMGKTRDLFKKIRDTKGTYHVKMGSIKDRNGMDHSSRRY